MPTFAKLYGAHPAHLLSMLAGFGLLGYTLITFPPSVLWNQDTWWQSIAVWFVVAVIAHDFVLFPLYALADRGLAVRRRSAPQARKVPARNYIRVPVLAAGLTLLIFLPGIIEQGAPTYHAATGQTQQPFLGRWLLLSAVMFAISAVAYAVRRSVACRRAADGAHSEQSIDLPKQ
jgi:hypothetical protein